MMALETGFYSAKDRGEPIDLTDNLAWLVGLGAIALVGWKKQ
jgi:hypothetical protein